MPYSNRDKQREYQRKWIARRRKEYFSDKSCVDCDSKENLELDHTDPNTKISHNIWSWSEVRRNLELKKCVVRCNSCHESKTTNNGERGIRYKGSINSRSAVTSQQVIEIKELYATGLYTYPDIAKIFNIGRSTVGHIVTNYRYREE